MIARGAANPRASSLLGSGRIHTRPPAAALPEYPLLTNDSRVRCARRAREYPDLRRLATGGIVNAPIERDRAQAALRESRAEVRKSEY